MTTKMKLMALGLGMALFTGCSAVDDLIEKYAEDDDDMEVTSFSTFYLKDSTGTGVANIPYSCFGGYIGEEGEELITSGNTSSEGEMTLQYWPNSNPECTVTLVDSPELYLYDANGPINNVLVDCVSSDGFTGEDGHDGSINNTSSDTCIIRHLDN